MDVSAADIVPASDAPINTKETGGKKFVGGNMDTPLPRSPPRKSQCLPLAMVIVTVENERSAKNEGC